MARWKELTAVVSLAAVLSAATSLEACPFCNAVSQTFSEEIASMDAVVIAELVEAPKAPAKTGQEVAKARFTITKVLKGETYLGEQKTVEAIYYGQAREGRSYLITAVDPPKLMWSTPLPLSAKSSRYLERLLELPKDPVDRLVFFQNYFEADEEMLAQDAYDEFAKAPYEVIQSMKERMHHDRLVQWIKDADVPPSRRRLYLTMLGVCGTSNDIGMLETMLKSTNRRDRAGLDALIACYLTLRGPEGVELVEDLFLKNKKSDYADTYAAIMALRFHGTETEVIPRGRIVKAMRHMLDRSQLADLVIADLARWEDWSQIQRLGKLFKEANEKNSWVRVPVVQYLQQCPKPEAKELLAELRKIDPAAVKRANTFFPLGPVQPDPDPDADPKADPKADSKAGVQKTPK